MALKRKARRTKPVGRRSGGKWGDGVRERLRAVIRENGPSNAAFAHRCGVEPPRVSEWVGGDQLPSFANLRQICAETGVSADWLLLGDGGTSPLPRQQSRSMAALEEDLAAAVRVHVHRREAAGAFDTNPGSGVRMSLHGWIVDGAGLLADICENEEQKVRDWIEWEAKTEPLQGISEDIMRALRVLVPLLPADDTAAGVAVYHLGELRLMLGLSPAMSSGQKPRTVFAERARALVRTASTNPERHSGVESVS